MDTFLFDLGIMFNVEELFAFKEQLKNEIVNPTINWQTRMNLYKKVQMINERIQYLQVG
jgi:hypothetical protein